MNDKNYEKLVKQKTEGKILALKIALIFFYVIFAAVGFTLTILFAKANPALILLVGAIDSVIIFFSWRFTCIEYEYSILAGSLYVAKIYGKTNRKEIFEEELSRATTIAPYNEKYAPTADNAQADKVIYAISSMSAPHVWFAIFELEGAEKVTVFFEADERALKSLRNSNPRATARENYVFSDSTEELSENKVEH